MRLSDKARRFIEAAAAAGNQIMISPITLAEIVYPCTAEIVAATAIYFGVPVISRDSRISTASVVQTVW